MARHYKKSRRTTRKKSQRGGGASYGFTGAAFQTPGGVSVENRAAYSHCADPRAGTAPNVTAFETTQFGGKRQRSRKQRGGGCGCMAWPSTKQSGGGSGNGGFAVDVTSNEMMKSYASLVKAPCPTSQMGGAAVNDHGIVSYKTGYGFDTSSPVSTDSAHYLNPIGYNRTMAGGRRSRSAPRKGRKSRKSH